MARPHLASIIEDAFHRRTNAWLRGRGWKPRTIGHTGYGSPEFVRVLGRVVLSRSARDQPLPGAEVVQRGWRAFLTAPALNVPVTVTVNGVEARTRTDRSGYIDLTLMSPGLEPGWHEATLAADDARPMTAPVRIVDPSAGFGIISDIDDTVIRTMLPRPLIAAWNTFVRHETARHVIPGMARMYRTMLGERPGAPMFYLSTGAWNTAPTLTGSCVGTATRRGRCCSPTGGRRTPGGSAADNSTSRTPCTGSRGSSPSCSGCWSATTGSTTRRSTTTSR